VDDEDTEPPVPAGLGELSAPLRAVADFLEIDKDLIAVAAQASPPLGEQRDDRLTEWIASVPAREKDSLLTRVACGEGAAVQALLLRRFRRTAAAVDEAAAGSRTAAERRLAQVAGPETPIHGQNGTPGGSSGGGAWRAGIVRLRARW
jgi:hypothetical protein